MMRVYLGHMLTLPNLSIRFKSIQNGCYPKWFAKDRKVIVLLLIVRIKNSVKDRKNPSESSNFEFYYNHSLPSRNFQANEGVFEVRWKHFSALSCVLSLHHGYLTCQRSNQMFLNYNIRNTQKSYNWCVSLTY